MNIDTIGNLIHKKNNNNVKRETIDMKKIFNGYKSKKSKQSVENPYYTTDPVTYAKSKALIDLQKKMKGY